MEAKYVYYILYKICCKSLKKHVNPHYTRNKTGVGQCFDMLGKQTAELWGRGEIADSDWIYCCILRYTEERSKLKPIGVCLLLHNKSIVLLLSQDEFGIGF